MPNPADIVLEFILDRSADDPTAKRIELYRAAAATIADEDAARTLGDFATVLEGIDERAGQLLLSLRQPASPQPPTGKDGK